jgi:DNA repair protein SbcC/Rad50
MIPRRIKLEGFLSYKEPQEIQLEGECIWLFSGANGSGKSSLFDALTYALFGSHRGGSTNAGELIHRDCDKLAVEFEFQFETKQYLIRRTYRRSKTGNFAGTQQVYRARPNLTSEMEWDPIPQTNLATGFSEWVKNELGLNYKTFTSSVLLMQGQSEKLLDSTSKGRFEVLAELIDLDRYRRLHLQVVEKNRQLKSQSEGIRQNLSSLPGDLESRVKAAGEATRQVEAQLKQCESRVAEVLDSRLKAEQWLKLVKQREAIQKEIERIGNLRKQQAGIQSDFIRYEELGRVLPVIDQLVTTSSEVATTKEKLKQVHQTIKTSEQELKQSQMDLQILENQILEWQKQLATAEVRIEEIQGKLPKILSLDSQLGQYEKLESDLAEIEKSLKVFKESPELKLKKLQEQLELWNSKVTHQVTLDDLLRGVQKWKQSALDEADAGAEEKRLSVEGKEEKNKLLELQQQHESLLDQINLSGTQLTQIRTLLNQAENDLSEFGTVDGKRKCRSCGQALTKAHLKEEKDRRLQEVAERKAKFESQDSLHQQLTGKLNQLVLEMKAKDAVVIDLRDKYRNAKQRLEHIQLQRTQFQSELEEKQRTLPAPYRQLNLFSEEALKQLESWRTELLGMKQQLESARVEQAELVKLQAQYSKLNTQKEIHLANFAVLKKAVEGLKPKVIREEKLQLQADETQFKQLRTTLVDALKSSNLKLEAGRKAQELIKSKLNKSKIDEATASTRIETLNLNFEAILKRIPESWRDKLGPSVGMSERIQWTNELENLENSKIVDRYHELQKIDGLLELIQTQQANINGEIEEIPEVSRCNPLSIDSLLADARKELEVVQLNLRKAFQDLAILERQQLDYQKWESERQVVDREQQFHAILTDLLGRDNLQRHLISRGERQIVDLANSILDRLSNGDLSLRLKKDLESGMNSEEALDLEVQNRRVGGRPIGIAFLSGSQRFRVAVSLALGIGQFASRGVKPIESVIIDEGFGCLDREGRESMIQELQNLKTQLKCVLLVSHQEEFAEAFPNSYRFELQNGATRVSRSTK